MSLLQNLNLTLNELEDLRNNQELSWDEIAIKIGKSRNTIKRVIIKLFGDLGWDKLSKRESIKDLAVVTDKSEPKTEQKIELESKTQEAEVQEPYFKYFMTSLDDNAVIVTVYLDGEKYSKTIESPAILMKVQDAIHTKNYKELKNLLSIEDKLKESGITYKEVSSKYNINGIELDEGCRDLVMKCHEETVNGTHDSLTGLVAMVHNLNKAEKLDVLEQLYSFLKHNDIEILNDGSFICYKYLSKCDGKFVDAYTQTIKQDVGDYVYTYEDMVDDDPTRYCSYGLHVAAWNYLSSSYTIAKVRVLAEDVISVPYDYNGSKLRCKGYTILEIKEDFPSLESFTKTTELDLHPKNNVFVQTTR